MTTLAIGLVRHGHSAAQEVRDRAEAAGALRFFFDPPDALAPLSERGREEARRLGAWLLEQGHTPSAVIASPYRRTAETAELVVSSARLSTGVIFEDALVEIGWGEFDGLTKAGRRARYPEHFESLSRDKFNVSPPGGESWSEVAARVRPVAERVLRMNGLVLIVCHEVTVKCLRHVLEAMSPEQTLGLRDVPNASLTLYRRQAETLQLELENFVPYR
jgi:broad specificity phosphatase PhoE